MQSDSRLQEALHSQIFALSPPLQVPTAAGWCVHARLTTDAHPPSRLIRRVVPWNSAVRLPRIVSRIGQPRITRQPHKLQDDGARRYLSVFFLVVAYPSLSRPWQVCSPGQSPGRNKGPFSFPFPMKNRVLKQCKKIFKNHVFYKDFEEALKGPHEIPSWVPREYKALRVPFREYKGI